MSGRGYGTLAFMAPEQSKVVVGKIGTYTDVFAVGATLHWCLTGQPLLLFVARITLICGMHSHAFIFVFVTYSGTHCCLCFVACPHTHFYF